MKVFDYLAHAASANGVCPQLYLTPDSDPALAEQWVPAGVPSVPSITEADAYFVAGMDWQILDRAGVVLQDKLVINLIQGARHAITSDPRYRFLSRRAVRICVSPEVREAILRTAVVNGPVAVICNGLDLAELEHHRRESHSPRIFIGGQKNPEMAHACAQRLAAAGIPVDLSVNPVPRSVFLDRIADSQVSILLPKPIEGFFLPALEAMVLGSPVVVPDCVGARGFCRHEETCLVPPYDVAGLCIQALRLWQDAALRDRLCTNARTMALSYSKDRERLVFQELLSAYLHQAPRL